MNDIESFIHQIVAIPENCMDLLISFKKILPETVTLKSNLINISRHVLCSSILDMEYKIKFLQEIKIYVDIDHEYRFADYKGQQEMSMEVYQYI